MGETVLVVAGILIALQINNANEERLERQHEAVFLANLEVDLQFAVRELDRFIEVRAMPSKRYWGTSASRTASRSWST